MNLRRRMMMGVGGGSSPSGPLPGEVFGTSVQPLDVVFVDSSDEIHIIHGEENWPSDCTPIGVVLVPGSHNRYGNTSMHGVCALTSINHKRGETGYIDPPSDTCFATGDYASYDTGLTDYWGSYEGIQYAAIPYLGTNSVLYWDKEENDIYFPYTQNDTVATPSGGALSDFNGEENTAVYASVSRANHGYVNIALNYSTAGTSAGDWYIPAAGELAYNYYYKDLLISLNTSLSSAYSIDVHFVSFYDFSAENAFYAITSTEKTTDIWCITDEMASIKKSKNECVSALFTRIVK